MADLNTSEYLPRLQLTRASFCSIIHKSALIKRLEKAMIAMVTKLNFNLFIAIFTRTWIQNSIIRLVVEISIIVSTNCDAKPIHIIITRKKHQASKDKAIFILIRGYIVCEGVYFFSLFSLRKLTKRLV